LYTIASAIYAQQPMITKPAFTKDFEGAKHADQKLPLTKGEVLLEHVSRALIDQISIM